MSSASAAALKDYAPMAASLFNNMKTPASILAGAIVPLGFLSPLPQPPARIAAVVATKKGKEEPPLAVTITKNLDRMLRKSYLLVTLLSFGSELLAVMWATGKSMSLMIYGGLQCTLCNDTLTLTYTLFSFTKRTCSGREPVN